jgi:hypothetical protein
MTVMTLCGYMVCAFLGLLAGTVLWKIWRNEINLCALLSEANGDASMSRFQLLIFTFVIAASLFELVERSNPGAFPLIPNGILTLLGISASTYAVSKGISYSRDEGVMTDKQVTDDQNMKTSVAASNAAAAEAHAKTAVAAAIVSNNETV